MEIEFNPLKLTGRKILVTGASSGIGRATAIYISKLGAQVVVHGRDEKRVQDTISRLSGTGHSGFCCDLSAEDDLEKYFKSMVEDGKKLSGMVHSAGISSIMSLRGLKRARLEQIMSVNFYSFIELPRQYSKKKYSDGGSIVGLSSIASVEGEQCQTAYSASKAALNAAVRTLAIELYPQNIRVNAVMPGMINTEIVQKSVENGGDMGLLSTKSLCGIGEPDQVAAPIAFLLSEMSSFITGRCLYVDGGRLL